MTQTAPAPSAQRPTEPTELARHRFTVDDYYRMAQAGILDEDSRVELLDGEIIDMPPFGPDHGGTVNRVARFFFEKLGRAAVIQVQNPVRLSQRSEPQPDVSLLKPREDLYQRSHAVPQDILLLVEVADTTLERDRRGKLPLYARAGVAEVWLLDVPGRNITIYRQPAGDAYAQTTRHAGDERFSPLAFPALSVGIADLLG
jgi:Uma2 family endonuclease